MALEEKLSEKFRELEKRSSVNRRLATYIEAHDGVSQLKSNYDKSSIGDSLKSTRQKQLAALSGSLSDNLRDWDGYAYFLFGDVFKNFESRRQGIDIMAKASSSFTQDRIRMILSELLWVKNQNGHDLKFKGAVEYVRIGNAMYGMVYFKLAGNL